MPYDDYERELLDADERNLIKGHKPSAAEMRRFRDAARNTLRKDRRINIRMSERDLLALQRKPNRYGLPYQTFISSILHRYAAGEFHEVRSGKG